MQRKTTGMLLGIVAVGAFAYWAGHPVAPPARPASRIVTFAPPPAPVQGPGQGPSSHAPDPPKAIPVATTPMALVPSAAWTQQLRDEMCACKSRACITEVDARYAAELSAVDFSDLDREATARASHEAGECKAKILNAG